MSSGLGLIWERGWVSYHEAFDAGGGWCRTPGSNVGVPAWHDAGDLRTFEVGYFAGGSRMVEATTKTALSAFGTIDGTMVREDFPTFVAEMGVQGTGALIRVRAMLRLKRGFIGEDSPEHACRDSGVDESVGSGEEVVMVVMEALLKFFGVCGELLL